MIGLREGLLPNSDEPYAHAVPEARTTLYPIPIPLSVLACANPCGPENRQPTWKGGEGGEIGMNGVKEEERLPKTEASVLRGHEGAVLAARFNSDGNYCLSCGKDRTLRLWNPHRGIHIKTYKSHGREVRDVHVTLDNAKLCSCGGDRQVFYWDVSTGRVIRKFRGHDSEVRFPLKN